MKKKLLKPPADNGEILLIPTWQKILKKILSDTKVAVAHQPYFFNPGVSLKFFLLNFLPTANKCIVFIDSDRIKLRVTIPTVEGYPRIVRLLEGEEVLYQAAMLKEKQTLDFFSTIEKELKKLGESWNPHYHHMQIFKEIFMQKHRKKYLKEALVESILQYHNLDINYEFLSTYLRKEIFHEFFLEIYRKADIFRDIFNQALDDYRVNYRFRYKNFPYPKLQDGELPFWLLKGNVRERLFKDNIANVNLKDMIIFPRAVTLTIFLRLYLFQVLIHGIGGANYEPLQDMIIERFFHKIPPFYIVVSGTFLLPDFYEREVPFFFFDLKEIKYILKTFLLADRGGN